MELAIESDENEWQQGKGAWALSDVPLGESLARAESNREKGNRVHAHLISVQPG